MSSIEELFQKEGVAGVSKLQQSIETAGRNATGGTSRSIKSFVKTTGTITTLIIRAVDHKNVHALEDGMTAAEVTREATNSGIETFYSDIETWANSKSGVDSSNSRIIANALVKKGWNNTLPGRNATGGTDGVLSDPGQIIVEDIIKGLGAAGKKDVLRIMRGGKNE